MLIQQIVSCLEESRRAHTGVLLKRYSVLPVFRDTVLHFYLIQSVEEAGVGSTTESKVPNQQRLA